MMPATNLSYNMFRSKKMIFLEDLGENIECQMPGWCILSGFNPLMLVGNCSYQFFLCCPRDCVSRTANVEGNARH